MTLAIIPARAGSKGVKNKNIRQLKSLPIIAYSIKAALQSNFSRVIVSTDSEIIADIAKEYGADVPFLRPKEYATDTSGDHEYLSHAITWLHENEKKSYDNIAILRPTTPIRESKVLNQAIELFNKTPSATSLRSLQELAEPPQKMLQIKEDGFLDGFFPNDPRPEYYNLPRQLFPTAYLPNGYIDMIRSTNLTQQTSQIFGQKVLGFKTPASIEIDTEDDFSRLEYTLEKVA